MRLFLCYEEGFHKCILYTKIFDSISVQSLSEQKDFYVNFIVQALQNQLLDCGGLFRLVQERWHHLKDLSQIALLPSLEMCLWQVRHVQPLFSFLWNFSNAAYHQFDLIPNFSLRDECQYFHHELYLVSY